MEKGLLSVCCLGYNHAKFMEACVSSVWNNDYKNVEIVVVDDGSKDNSVEVLESLKAKSPCPFTYIAQENTGNTGINFNRAVEKSNGEFLLFISLDDTLAPNSLAEKMKYVLEDDSVAYVVSKRVAYIDINGKIIKRYYEDKFDSNTTNEQMREIEFNTGTFAIQNAIIRRAVFDSVGGYDNEIKADDIVLRTRLTKYLAEHPEWKFKTEDKTEGFYYRQHSNNVSKNSLYTLSIYLEVYNKYWSDRPYPDYVKEVIARSVAGLPYEKTKQLLDRYPKAMDLLNNDERFKIILKAKFKNEKSKFIKYIYKYEPTYNRNIFKIFGIKLCGKVRKV